MPKPKDSHRASPPSTEIQRLLVLTGQMGDDVRRVADGHALLERQIAQTRQELVGRMDELENRMNLGFRDLSERVGRLEKEVAQVKQELAQVKQELAQVKQAVFEVDRKLETHEQTHAP